MNKRPDEPTNEQPEKRSPGPESDAAKRSYLAYTFVLIVIIGALILWAFTR